MLSQWPTYAGFFMLGPFMIAMSFRPSPPVLYWAGVATMMLTGLQLLYQVSFYSTVVVHPGEGDGWFDSLWRLTFFLLFSCGASTS
jgi:hypothetical protein